MLILTNRSEALLVEDVVVRRFLDRRIAQLCDLVGGSGTVDVGGQWVVVQEGDTPENLEEVVGVPLLHGLFDDAPFGSDDFAPAFEWATDHGDLYEVLFAHSDGGDFTSLVIPRRVGIDSQLLALCAAYATPEPVQP